MEKLNNNQLNNSPVRGLGGNAWGANFWSAFRLTFFLLLICAIIYPLLVLGIAKITPDQGYGEKITDKNGKTYFANIGQKFDKDVYFHSRPSAVDYNAAGSGGSNKGPTNPEYLKTVQERVNEFRAKNPDAEIPVDMVTAGGSGLDPHVSVTAAEAQINRVASARNISPEKIKELVNKHTEKLFFGPARINVLKLNIELDKMNN